MRWRVVYWIGVFAWFLAVASPRAQADPLPDQYLHIFEKMNDAELLRKQGDYKGALADYTDCYEKLEKIHKTDPDWEAALVMKRIADCQTLMQELQPLANAQLTTPAPAPVPAPPSTDAATPTQPGPASPPPESADAALPTDVTTLQQELLAMKQELEIWKQKYNTSQAENVTLKQQFLAVNEQLEALKNQQSVDDRIGKLMTQNTELTDKLAAAEQELDEIKGNPKSTLAMVRAQLKNAKDELAQAQSQNDVLQQTTTSLKQQLDQAQSELTIANQKLVATDAGSPEYLQLKRDNEIMRDILTRELQEQAHRDMAKRLYQEEYDRLKINSKVLSEQVDILSSPMTPPTTDQERDLLNGLKVSATEVAAIPANVGNTFSAQAVGAGTNAPATDPTTNGVAATPATAPPTTTVADNAATTTSTAPATNLPVNSSTPTAPANQDPITVTIDGATVATVPTAPTAPSAPNTAASSPPPSAPPSSPTEGPAVATTSNTPTAADPSVPGPANAGTTTPPPAAATDPPSSPASAPMDTTAAATPAATPSAPTDQASVAITATNSGPNPNTIPSSPPASTDTTAAPGPAQSTTTVTDTTIQNGGSDANSAQQDPERYSKVPRLPDDMNDTAQAAADLFKMGRYDEAADKYQEIIEKYPESLYAWSNLGVVRFQQKNYEAALKALQQAVKLSPADAFSYSNLGIVYYQMGQYDSAISSLEKALALEPNDAKSCNYLGCACSQKGWQEVAEKQFLKAIQIDPDFGDAHFNLALIYATEKPPSVELAKRHYSRALELGIAKDERLEKLLQIPQ